MRRQPASSSNLKSVGYDPGGRVLEIEFQDGGVYQYDNVPKEVYVALMEASSHGSFFHRNISNNYPYRKVQ